MILTSLFFSTLVLCAQASVSGFIGTPADEYRLLSALTSGFVKLQPGEIESIYYAAKGYKLLDKTIVKVLQMDSCAHLEAQFKKDSPPEQSFQALSAWSLIGCSGKLHSDATINVFKAALEKPETTADIRFAIEGLQLLGQPIAKAAKAATLLQERLKEDDSLQSLGHALHAASLIGAHGKFALDRVEDVVVQADEVDNRMLQWEGGLTTTGLLLTGLYRLPGSKPLTQNQADKFANYLLTRKSVQTSKGALILIESAMALAASSVSPVSITVVGSSQVTTENPDLKVRVSDILGKALKPAPTPVVAQSATRVADDVVVLSKQPLSAGNGPTEFVLPLRLEPGQYRIMLAAAAHQAVITARVLGPISLQSIEIGTGDSDGSSAAKLNTLQFPNKITSTLQADSNQNLIVKFALARSVHQAFLRLHSEAKEIVFIAEKDTAQMYKVNVNLASEIGQSGTFEIELILGDSIMSNPIRWSLGEIEIKLNTAEASKIVARGPKPEIKHMFREAEKRPPQGVSMFFTLACAVPLALLPLIWLKIGFNFSHFNFYSIPFHVGLGAIFLLFTCFWLKLNMFTTCALLLPIGGFTFLSGNRLLRKIANTRKQ